MPEDLPSEPARILGRLLTVLSDEPDFRDSVDAALQLAEALLVGCLRGFSGPVREEFRYYILEWVSDLQFRLATESPTVVH